MIKKNILKWVHSQQNDHHSNMIKILLTKDIDPPESSTDLAWISRAGIVALRICCNAVFWGRVPTPTLFAWANRCCWYVWWSEILDFRLQTNNRCTVHACQGMTSNQTEHSTVVGTVKVKVSYFHLFCYLICHIYFETCSIQDGHGPELAMFFARSLAHIARSNLRMTVTLMQTVVGWS